jgi:preprotein translocase YajC subunit
MNEGNSWLFWIILIVGSLVFLYVPQLMARRRQKKREEELAVGDRVMTIGGFIGELVYLNFKTNLARIRLADNLIVDILPGAISGKRVEVEEVEPVTENDSEG